jgi:hypothetical protein
LSGPAPHGERIDAGSGATSGIAYVRLHRCPSRSALGGAALQLGRRLGLAGWGGLDWRHPPLHIWAPGWRSPRGSLSRTGKTGGHSPNCQRASRTRCIRCPPRAQVQERCGIGCQVTPKTPSTSMTPALALQGVGRQVVDPELHVHEVGAVRGQHGPRGARSGRVDGARTRRPRRPRRALFAGKAGPGESSGESRSR